EPPPSPMSLYRLIGDTPVIIDSLNSAAAYVPVLRGCTGRFGCSCLLAPPTRRPTDGAGHLPALRCCLPGRACFRCLRRSHYRCIRFSTGCCLALSTAG